MRFRSTREDFLQRIMIVLSEVRVSFYSRRRYDSTARPILESVVADFIIQWSGTPKLYNESQEELKSSNPRPYYFGKFVIQRNMRKICL